MYARDPSLYCSLAEKAQADATIPCPILAGHEILCGGPCTSNSTTSPAQVGFTPTFSGSAKAAVERPKLLWRSKALRQGGVARIYGCNCLPVTATSLESQHFLGASDT